MSALIRAEDVRPGHVVVIDDMALLVKGTQAEAAQGRVTLEVEPLDARGVVEQDGVAVVGSSAILHRLARVDSDDGLLDAVAQELRNLQREHGDRAHGVAIFRGAVDGQYYL